MQTTHIRELSDLAIETAIECTCRQMTIAHEESEIDYWKERNEAYVAELMRRNALKSELREIVESL